MIEVEDLTKSFSVGGKVLQAVRGVDFVVNQGETVAVVGESGSGKSTIANLLLALEDLTAGSIVFEGRPLTHKRTLSERRDIQMVFQDPHSSFNPRMKMREAMFEPFFVQGIYKTFAEAEPEILESLDLVGLNEEALGRYPHAFSGGQLQRLAIARALLLKPKLLVLDEPLSSLDISLQAQIVQLLANLKKTLNLTLLFITHDLQVVRAFADRVVVLYLGKVMEMGKTELLFKEPHHPYTEVLLSSIPPQNPWDKKEPMAIGDQLPSPFDPPSGCPFRTRCPYVQPQCANPIPKKSEGDQAWWCIFDQIPKQSTV